MSVAAGLSLARDVFRRAWAEGFKPDPTLRVSEWADRFRQLSSATSPEASNYRTDRTPFWREVMDALSVRHPARRIVVIGAAQSGKSTVGQNWTGYVMHLAPGAMLIVLPTVEDAEGVSKEQITPMIELCPELRELVSENRSRQGSNTIVLKKFRGGFLALTGANSARGLRRRPIRNLFVDELDAFPEDVDGEGDPLALAEKRMTNFAASSKELITSTPTIKGRSRIEREYNASDQRRYFVPCPACGHFDWLRWQSIDYRDDPANPTWICGSCEEKIPERYKTEMLAAGEWRPTAVSRSGTLGYHLSGLYSPLGWLSWAKIVEEHIASEQDVSLRKTWVNTRLAETWEDRSETVDENALLARCNERYGADVPDGVGVLVAAVDVQADRLEWKVKGYGIGEESWLIATGQIPCADPEQSQAWLDLDRDVLLANWDHVSGQKMRISCTAVDSGYKSDAVYRFCRLRADRRVFAVRGGRAVGKPLVERPTTTNSHGARLYTLCVNTGKDTVGARLRIARPGPGFMHLPDSVGKDYIDQLTAERCFTKFVRGQGAVRVWEKIRDRNEAWDLEVYCLAALKILGEPFIRTLATRAERYRVPVLKLGDGEEPGDAAAAAAPQLPEPAPLSHREPPAPPQRSGMGREQRGGWVRNWRGRR